MGRKKIEQEIKQEVFEEKEGANKLAKVCTAVALYGLAVLTGYIVIAPPETGTAMGAFRDVLYGLGGSLAIFIPIIIAWIATLVLLPVFEKKISVWKSVLDGLLFLCFMTIIHLFFTETIIRTRMTIAGFANFVSKSYAYGHGGGALGALLAWPLYNSLGKVGGILAALLIMLLSLTATGKSLRFVRFVQGKAEIIQHDSEQRRRVKEVERMFDYDEPEPVKKQPLHRVRTDEPFDMQQSPQQRPQEHVKPRVPRSAPEKRDPMRENLRRDLRKPTPNDDPMNGRTAETEEPMRAARRPVEAEDPMSTAKKPSAAEEPIRAQNSHPTEKVEETAQEAPKRPMKKRKMYHETIEEGVRPLSLLDEDDEGLTGTIEVADDGPTMAAFDGSNREQPRKRTFAPDTAQSVEKMRESAANGDDLRIEPEQSDVLEGADDCPFDLPEKKPLGKLKRPTKPVEPTEDEEEYNYPPIDLLQAGEEQQDNHRDADLEKAALLEETLQDFGISSKLTGIAHGPAVTRFELQPAPGIKVSRITGLSDDIALRLAAMSVRIEAPIPGKAAVGVEIPNEKVETVHLRDVLESAEARKSVSKVAVGLGKDNSGRYIVADIAKMPHVLIAGQTGSGKSVCINSIISSILYRATPDEVRLILIDPKVVELSIYNDIPHLVCPVVTDCKKAASALDWAVAEMSMRYKKFAERGVRDIKGYNKALLPGEKIMPQMVIVIDELADLMMVAPGEVEDSICRLAQLARAAGMHLVIATQRPSVNVITGTIKANIPTRIAFSVASQIDSRTMIDHGGAEKLLGNGDMLFVPSGINKPMRVQGAWISDEEVHAVVSYIKERSETTYDPDMIEQIENATRSDAEREEVASEYDPRLPEAVEIVVEAGQASVSMLQRRMRVGYARAGRLIDEMEQRGIVSEADGAKPRTVLISRDEMNLLFDAD